MWPEKQPDMPKIKVILLCQSSSEYQNTIQGQRQGASVPFTAELTTIVRALYVLK